MVRIIASVVVVVFLRWPWARTAIAGPGKTLTGTVRYEDLSPAPGVVVYALDMHHRLNVSNNTVMMAEHIPRAISDTKGRFGIKEVLSENVCLFARDLEDWCTFTAFKADTSGSAEIVIQKPAIVKGQLFKGDQPIEGKKITARYLTEMPVLQYVHTAVTNAKGAFVFGSLMPGEYLFQVIEDVPQVGCSFSSVVTKQLRAALNPGQQTEIKLGRTNLPFLHGKITDADGNGLHGVWVRLEPQEPDPTQTPPQQADVVWSDVTMQDGSYRIFDIPPGGYTLHCFRRLALNNSTRTLQAAENVIIESKKNEKASTRTENIRNISIDLEPLMPLKYGQPAPALSAKLLNGGNFDLSALRGKIIILHFYATWCSVCVSTTPFFDKLADEFSKDKVAVVGISLDNTVEQCRRFVRQKKIHHPQLFAGPWVYSRIRKDFRVVDVPTSFVIDKDGKIAQIDLFNETLKNFVLELLETN